MKELNPTLWRTCRVLAGKTRIRLFRALITHPGNTVSQLARETGVGISDASQELRRLQSRGLLQVHQQGSAILYHPSPDPQVSSAAPLLKALLFTVTHHPPNKDDDILRIATALSYKRRIQIARALKLKSQQIQELETTLGFHRQVLNRHLRKLLAGGFVQRKGRVLVFRTPSHPLGKVLARLLEKA